MRDCKDLKVYNYILTIYLLLIICKNIAMSLILFLSLYRFYKGLKRIGLKFSNKNCNLAMHITAFGLPVIAGFVYIFFIFHFN